MFFVFVSDVVDWILQNLINTSRSHRGVSKKLRELGYNVGTKVSSTLLYSYKIHLNIFLTSMFRDPRQFLYLTLSDQLFETTSI
jgi:hypothetical protein